MKKKKGIEMAELGAKMAYTKELVKYFDMKTIECCANCINYEGRKKPADYNNVIFDYCNKCKELDIETFHDRVCKLYVGR